MVNVCFPFCPFGTINSGHRRSECEMLIKHGIDNLKHNDFWNGKSLHTFQSIFNSINISENIWYVRKLQLEKRFTELKRTGTGSNNAVNKDSRQ